MYRHIAFNEVSANFSGHFDCSISPYYDRAASATTGKLQFIQHKFVRYLMREKGYAGSAEESLRSFICRRYSDAAWGFLARLM